VFGIVAGLRFKVMADSIEGRRPTEERSTKGRDQSREGSTEARD
jgi:hypothetical protein